MIKQRVAIFASGTGSNAINLIHHFKNHEEIEVAFVLSNKNDAPVIESALDLGIKVYSLSNEQVADAELLIELCHKELINWVVLAGYLRLIPKDFIKAFEGKIINLHPSLLPKYGGKGFHGRHVHEAVLANHETETGITIHFVNENFDEGKIIAQFHCQINKADSIDVIESKIRYLEQRYLPVVIQNTIMNKE